MNHPFNIDLEELKALDLDFEEPLTVAEAAQVGGISSRITTMALGEEGGALGDRRPFPIRPRPKPIYPIDPPVATTLALGEEGGWSLPDVATQAFGEKD